MYMNVVELCCIHAMGYVTLVLHLKYEYQSVIYRVRSGKMGIGGNMGHAKFT